MDTDKVIPATTHCHIHCARTLVSVSTHYGKCSRSFQGTAETKCHVTSDVEKMERSTRIDFSREFRNETNCWLVRYSRDALT